MGTSDMLCDGLASYPGGSSNTLSYFMLRKPGQAMAVWACLALSVTLPLLLPFVKIKPISKA